MEVCLKDLNDINPRGRTASVPKASSITEIHLDKAYIQKDRRQQRRIERFGAINRGVLQDLGAAIVSVNILGERKVVNCRDTQLPSAIKLQNEYGGPRGPKENRRKRRHHPR